MNFGSVTQEFKRGKGVYPSAISSLATFALLLDRAGSVLSFLGDHYSVLFYLYARGRHCYGRGLHARICHAFLVLYKNMQYLLVKVGMDHTKQLRSDTEMLLFSPLSN